MDGLRTVGPAAGFRWLMDAINIGRRGAFAIFGGAALLLLVAMCVMVVFLAVGVGTVFALGQSAVATFVLWIVLMLPMLLFMAFGFVGYVRMIDAVESGRPARATDALRGFADVEAGLRAFLVLLVVMVVQQLVMAALVAWLAPDVGRWYAASLHGAATNAAPVAMPSGFWKVYGVGLLFGMVANGMQSIALTQVALRDRGTTGALRDGIVGALRNLPALLVLVVSGIALGLVLLAAVVAVVMLLMAVGKLVALWLAVILGAALYLALLVAVFAVGGAAMYYMWRDIAGPGPVPAAVEA